MRVIAADKILADFARILSLLKGANLSDETFPSGEILPSVHITHFAKIPIVNLTFCQVSILIFFANFHIFHFAKSPNSILPSFTR